MVERFDEVKNKVEKIAFTDSVHSMPGHCRGQEGLTLERQQDIIQWFSKVCCYNIVAYNAEPNIPMAV